MKKWTGTKERIALALKHAEAGTFVDEEESHAEM